MDGWMDGAVVPNWLTVGRPLSGVVRDAARRDASVGTAPGGARVNRFQLLEKPATTTSGRRFGYTNTSLESRDVRSRQLINTDSKSTAYSQYTHNGHNTINYRWVGRTQTYTGNYAHSIKGHWQMHIRSFCASKWKFYSL